MLTRNYLLNLIVYLGLASIEQRAFYYRLACSHRLLSVHAWVDLVVLVATPDVWQKVETFYWSAPPQTRASNPGTLPSPWVLHPSSTWSRRT